MARRQLSENTPTGALLYKEYNDWEKETWHHIYFCSEAVHFAQLPYMQSVLKCVNELLSEKYAESDYTDVRPNMAIDFNYFHIPVPNEPSIFKCVYSIEEFSVEEAEMMTFEEEGQYQCDNRTYWCENNLPLYEEFYEILKRGGGNTLKNLVEEHLEELMALIFKSFTN